MSIEEQIYRIEERSLKILGMFVITWSTILFFIIKNDSEIFTPIFTNLKTILTGTINQAEVSFGGPWIFLIIFLSIITITKLLENSTDSLNKNIKNKKILEEKANKIQEATRIGLANTLLLLGFLLFVYILGDSTFVELLAVIKKTLEFIVTISLLIISPLIDMALNKKKKIVINIISILFGAYWLCSIFITEIIIELIKKINAIPFLLFSIIVILAAFPLMLYNAGTLIKNINKIIKNQQTRSLKKK